MNKQCSVLITGANGGMGQALCSVFMAENYHVIALDRQKKAEKKLKYDDYICVDLKKFVQDENYADVIVVNIKNILTHNELNCLINNAALQILGGVESLDRNDWNTTLAVNLQAPFFLTQALLPQMSKIKGSVINISSIHARLTKENFVAYASSKAALSGMTKAMAVDLKDKVRVNAIEPAAIATRMLKEGFTNKPELYQQLKNYHPSCNIGEPEEIAKLALFLASEQAKFIHGSCIDISGGISGSLHDPN